MAITIYHNPKCSKSRQTLKLLQEQGINPVTIEYLKNPPTVEKLKEILSLLGVSPRDLMRKKEDEFKRVADDILKTVLKIIIVSIFISPKIGPIPFLNSTFWPNP